jgi:ADP-heptose:LPS heptosyltransferase
VEYYNAQAVALGANSPSRYPSIPCPHAPRTFAAIQPFGSSSKKQAPLELFENLAQRLSESMPIQWLRGPEDRLPGAIHIANLYELACHLRGARIFVGNDSGVAHLAAAVGAPVLTVFPSGDARVWSPRGKAVHAITSLRKT